MLFFQVIELLNDGTGLGFGIVGGQSTGVVVKTICEDGAADRNKKLRSGDHLLKINNVHLKGMGSDQVACVLRQSGNKVTLVVARAIPSGADDGMRDNDSAVPSAIINEPHLLDEYLIAKEHLGKNHPALIGVTDDDRTDLPEVETFQVEIVKDSQG
jgi:hypothetical protein